MVGGSKCKEKSGIMHMRRKGRKGMRRSVGFMVVVKRYEWYKYLGSVELTHTTTTTTDHHTVQVVQVQEQFFARVGGCKTPPAQVAEGDTTMCVSELSALVSA